MPVLAAVFFALLPAVAEVLGDAEGVAEVLWLTGTTDAVVAVPMAAATAADEGTKAGDTLGDASIGLAIKLISRAS